VQQIFIEEKAELNKTVSFSEKKRHHLQHVLRMKEKEVIRIVDSSNDVFLAEIIIEEGEMCARCFEFVLKKAERKNDVTLLMGLIKKEKWDFCLQKCTELGVTRIVPFESMRTVVKSKEERSEKKLERWNKIVLEAAQQCKRDCVPEVTVPMKLMDAIDYYTSDLNLVAYESCVTDSKKLRDVIEDGKSMTLIIGPEGGFDEAEIAKLKEKGVECITLGNRILRAETAAIYALSAIDAILE